MNDDHEPGEWAAWPLPALPRKGEREIIDLQDANLAKGHRRRGGRTVVRLNTSALWKRLALLNRSRSWLAREIGISPGYLSMLVNAGRAPSGHIRHRMQNTLGVEDFHYLFKLEE